MRKTSYDATIVGAGPNGLTAAAVLAAAGLSVVVLERNGRIGGGCSTEAVTRPGFGHDICSAIHPMGRISKVFRRLQLESHELEWVATPSQLAHPLDDGRVALLAFKIDYALAGLIPWRSPGCAQSATVHLGRAYEEIVRSEADTAAGRIADAPFVLIAQQSLSESTRAPAGRHTGWAYCHVPHGSDVDKTSRIERQIERFAPGFRDVVLARHVMPPAALEHHNPNLIGGDINGGANALDQFIARPFPRWTPYTTSNPRLYLCSSSTPPGSGVHGICGYWAARTALRRTFNKDVPEQLAG